MISRRQLLQWSGCAAVGMVAPQVAAARAQGLVLRHLVTGERLEIDVADGVASTAGLGGIERILRDPATDERGRIDPQLIQQLLQIAAAWTPSPVYDVLDGYRSGARAAGTGLHGQGRAIDLRLAGVACADLAARAVAHGRGGVGYYRSADFVHLDSGAPRSWRG